MAAGMLVVRRWLGRPPSVDEWPEPVEGADAQSCLSGSSCSRLTMKPEPSPARGSAIVVPGRAEDGAEALEADLALRIRQRHLQEPGIAERSDHVAHDLDAGRVRGQGDAASLAERHPAGRQPHSLA